MNAMPMSMPSSLPALLRIDTIWLATAPLDMRAGIDSALARVVAVFGAAHPHCVYLFANKRANRIKLLMHDGLGIWLATRRLHAGGFWLATATQEPHLSSTLSISRRGACGLRQALEEGAGDIDAVRAGRGGARMSAEPQLMAHPGQGIGEGRQGFGAPNVRLLVAPP